MERAARPKRFARKDWLQLGLAALAEAGPAGLTVEALCARAGKTRGSFYSHFAGTEDFLGALAGHWRETFTEALIAAANRQGRPGARLDHLNQLAVRLDPRIEQGMRKLAAANAGVAHVCADADARRIAYLARLYEISGKFSRADAQALARIEYAAFVGFQQIAPDAGAAELRQVYQDFMKLTGRD